MRSELYQEYLYMIGKLKDAHGLTVDVDHTDIHTLYKDKQPLFKLFFGTFSENPDDPSIVVSFHVDLVHVEAIIWFMNIHKVHPSIQIHDSYVEDSNGETYLGEEALALREVFQAQEILANWLENEDRAGMEEFVKSDVVGRERDPHKSFNSQDERNLAMIEFERLRKPSDDDNIH